jgi:hypothetical protein
MYKELINRLIEKRKRNQIKIDFDLKRKVFFFSTPIFSSKSELPESVFRYVALRKNKTFKPHVTSFEQVDKTVLLIQEIPFSLGFQATLRKQAAGFLQMSQKCCRMLYEIAVEEKLIKILD